MRPRLAAESAGVHRERAADGARNPREERGRTELPAHAALREQHARETRARAHAAAVEPLELARQAPVAITTPRIPPSRTSKFDPGRARAAATPLAATPGSAWSSATSRARRKDRRGRRRAMTCAYASARCAAVPRVGTASTDCSLRTAFISAPRPARARQRARQVGARADAAGAERQHDVVGAQRSARARPAARRAPR